MTSGETMWKNWPEILALGLLIIGFFLAISMDNPFFVYFVVFLAGILAGRYYFTKIGKQPLFPFFLIIIGFLIGYALGSFSASRKIVIILFIIGWVASHYIHKKGYIPY
ncbi:hypothetical protein GF361_05015 [Candidatus Woesearchaeota archaeon]|nr:hypothetical protein [Candidatus Woesearchaeota archaeon]